jgi:DNA-binding NtrC family response regulator
MARILVVDDDPDAVDLLKELLTGEGHEIDTASDGDSALESFRAAAFDLVISDVRMPGKHGFSLLEEVRSRQEEVPVILITGFPSQQAVLDSVYRGAYAYVEKPFDIDYLVSLVRKALA